MPEKKDLICVVDFIPKLPDVEYELLETKHMCCFFGPRRRGARSLCLYLNDGDRISSAVVFPPMEGRELVELALAVADLSDWVKDNGFPFKLDDRVFSDRGIDRCKVWIDIKNGSFGAEMWFEHASGASFSVRLDRQDQADSFALAFVRVAAAT